jgi:voltage-gated potassium channel
MNDTPAQKSIRQRIFEIIDIAAPGDKVSKWYDRMTIVIIILSILPLTVKTENQTFFWLEVGAVSIFIVDYILRLCTADYKLKKGRLSFLIYPFTPMAIIDLLSILPIFTILNNGFILLRLVRLFRAVKIFRYSKSVQMLRNVIVKQKNPLFCVFGFAASYIMVCAIVLFNVEPDTFENILEALYWSTITLTTLGYGDVYPVTDAGRIVTMISSLVGVAIIALPSAIITAGYMNELTCEVETKTD